MKPLTLSIAAVERDTGLSKDTLRVWERRYGFPSPQRDSLGERAYPLDQVEKLRVIKRLLDSGHRPGGVVTLEVEALLELCGQTIDAPGRRFSFAVSPELEAMMERVTAHDLSGLRRQLSQAQMRLGLGRFVTDMVIPMNTLIGDAWMRGRIDVFQEHAYSEILQTVLRQAILGISDAALQARPRVLLTTFPGEPHGLGLLMAEALLALEGIRSISLGVQTPLWDMVLAAKAYQADVLALAFTGCTNPQQVTQGLAELRSKLPERVELWVGGAAPVLYRRPVAGVTAITTLAGLPFQAQRWRERPSSAG